MTSFQISFKLTKPRCLVDMELDVPLVDRSESALLLALRRADWQLFEWRKTKAIPYPDAYPLEFDKAKPPKKYFYVNAGRQSVGQSYLAALVGLSDPALVHFFKKQGVFCLKHLQAEKYYGKLLAGNLAQAEGSDALEFSHDGEAINSMMIPSIPAKKMRIDKSSAAAISQGSQAAGPAGPSAPLAPQLKALREGTCFKPTYSTYIVGCCYCCSGP